MTILNKSGLLIVILFNFLQPVNAQEENEQTALKQVLSQKGYDKTAPAIAKLVTDEGKKIGAGVVVGIHEDGAGFILTSYSMVAGRDKVAVILKDYPDPLLGYVFERWIDFDSDLAIVATKNFPLTQRVINFGNPKSAVVGKPSTVIGHVDDSDWLPIPFELTDSIERHFVFDAHEYSGIEGAPLVNDDGNLVGLIVSNDIEATEDENITLAVKSSVIKPILNEWFKPIPLQKKWREQGGGIATWIWALGGGVLGGSVATAILVAGGGEEPPRGLPRPPNPPNGQ